MAQVVYDIAWYGYMITCRRNNILTAMLLYLNLYTLSFTAVKMENEGRRAREI